MEGPWGRRSGAWCRHRPDPLGLPDGVDAHGRLCTQDCGVRCGEEGPAATADVPCGQASYGCLFSWAGAGGPHWLGRSFQKVSLWIKHGAFEGPAERDTICLAT